MVVTDIEWHLSGGNAVTNPKESFGGDISTSEVPQNIVLENGKEIGTNLLENLWDEILGPTAKIGYTDYRIIYIKNADADRPIKAATIYFKAPETPVYIRDPYKYADPPTTPPTKALDPIVANYPYLTTNLGNLSIGVLVPKNTSADRLTNVTTAPANVPFSAPRIDGTTITGTPLAIGDLDAGDYRALYVRRIVPANSPVENVATWGMELDYSSPE